MFMKIGLTVSNDAERLFVKKELKYTVKGITFYDIPSEKECNRALLNDKIDAYITPYKKFKNDSFLSQTNWFLFSWYEDYPYNTVFFGKKGNKVIAPPSVISSDEIANTLSKNISLSTLNSDSKIEKLLSLISSQELLAFVAPGRLAKYIQEEYKNIINTMDSRNIKIAKNKEKKEFCLLYNKNNKSILNILPYFIKSVTFVGAGVGSSELCSMAGIEALKHADVCLYDSLLDHNLLNYIPKETIAINVGKRHHNHSFEQPKINELIEQYARYGLRVVRLKSGDPSIFGRLAEEISYLENANIPYHVIPGISSLSSMAANTGIVLTRRGVNRGFCVMSPIKHGGEFSSVDTKMRQKLPIIFFMGVRVVDKIANNLMHDGLSKYTKAAVVFSIGGENECVVKGTLSTIANKIKPLLSKETIPPGLLIVGEISEFSFKKLSIFKRKKILVAGYGDKVDRISVRLKDFGAKSIMFSPKHMDEDEFYNILRVANNFSVLAFSEGNILESFIKSFIKHYKNIFKLPSIVVSSDDVKYVLKKFGLSSMCKKYNENDKVLYIYSKKSKIFYKQLQTTFVKVEENGCIKTKRRQTVGTFDEALFLDSESFWEFIDTCKENFYKDSFIWVEEDSEIISYLNKKSANFDILPNNLGKENTDIRFMLFNLAESKKSIAI